MPKSMPVRTFKPHVPNRADWVPDYKDVNTLQKMCSPQGKLYDRKRLGMSAKLQRRIAKAVKRARFLALLRYVGHG